MNLLVSKHSHEQTDVRAAKQIDWEAFSVNKKIYYHLCKRE